MVNMVSYGPKVKSSQTSQLRTTGLIRWGIVIHGFIDGYSRLITGLRASDNNRGQTVLTVFLDAVRHWGVPLRLRGDHGVENLLVAAWMNVHCGERRGSYIWGRYADYIIYPAEDSL